MRWERRIRAISWSGAFVLAATGCPATGQSPEHGAEERAEGEVESAAAPGAGDHGEDAAGADGVDNPFSLAIDLTVSEWTRHHRSSSYEVVVDGTRVEAHHLEGPDGSPVTYEISRDQVDILRGWLDRYDLLRTIEEDFDADAAGPRQEVDVDATFRVDGEVHEIRISGAITVRGQETEMEHRTAAEHLRWICRQFDRWYRESL